MWHYVRSLIVLPIHIRVMFWWKSFYIDAEMVPDVGFPSVGPTPNVGPNLGGGTKVSPCSNKKERLK
jgi:hypothetical protein